MSLPTIARGRASPTWWGAMVLFAVDATIFASLAFSHVHVSMKLDVCPPPGASLPAGGTASATALLLAASALMAWAVRRAARPGHRMLILVVLLAMGCSLAAFGIDLAAHLQAGLAPRHHAWSATVAALLAWQGLHAFVLLLMGPYLVVRALAGRLRPDARATLDHCALFWHYATLQGIATVVLVRYLPQWLGG